MPAEIKIYNAAELGTPLGAYSHVTRVRAQEYLFIAGMLATDKAGSIIGKGDFDAQAAQTFANVRAVLESAGASWKNVVQFTTYLVDAKLIEGFMTYRRREFPRMFAGAPYPPNTLLIIDRLVREEFLIEVQTIAAI
ncbi:MAG: RidA family protein [Burkholderiales bacterium]